MLQPPLNTFIDLIGDFPKPTVLDDTPGKELSDLLAAGLAKRGFKVTQVMDEGLGYHITCRQENYLFRATVTIDDLITIQRWNIITDFKVPFVERVLRRPWPSGFEHFLFAINDVLRESDRVTSIRWFPYFDTPNYLAIQPASEGPIPELSADTHLPLVIRFDRFLNWLNHLAGSPTGIVVTIAFLIGLGMVFSPTVAGIVSLVYFVVLLLICVVFPMFIGLYVAFTARKRCE